MKLSLNELRQLVKETLTETYFGASQQGSLASTAFNKVGPSDDMGTEIPIDPIDLAEQVRALIGGDAGFPLGDWGDEAFNAAAEAAADALINNGQKHGIQSSVRMFEQKNLIHEQINKVKNLLLEDVSDLNLERLTGTLNTIIELLTSMDMSLDLVYSTLSGHEGPISTISGLQKSYGRAMTARPRSTAVSTGGEDT